MCAGKRRRRQIGWTWEEMVVIFNAGRRMAAKVVRRQGLLSAPLCKLNPPGRGGKGLLSWLVMMIEEASSARQVASRRSRGPRCCKVPIWDTPPLFQGLTEKGWDGSTVKCTTLAAPPPLLDRHSMASSVRPSSSDSCLAGCLYCTVCST